MTPISSNKEEESATHAHPHASLAPIDVRNEICPDILSAIGNTPLVQLNSVPSTYGVEAKILCKCEFFSKY